MRTFWSLLGIAIALVVAGSLLVACPGQGTSAPVETAEQPTEPARPPAPAQGEGGAAADPGFVPDAHLQIDIGDITYGVYANLEILNRDVLPNLRIERLSSPRFDHRTQLLIMDILRPYPEELPMTVIFGSTRFLKGHTVIMKVHTFRQYTDASGEEVTEEILTFDRVIGNDRFVLQPDLIPFNPLDGMTELPETMLLFAELDAWLFLNTDVETFDPTTADLSEADYKRYPGFNPVRIYLVDEVFEE